MTAVLALHGLYKRYAEVRALEDVTLALAPGEVWGLLGHNGAGKTTLMKLALGILRPDAGTVEILGATPRGPEGRSVRRAIGYLPESVAFYGELTGREVLRYFQRLKGADPGQVERLLAEVDLREAAQRRVKTYSKGMRQRLGLAQALLGRPRLLLLDEPTVGLDPIATRRCYETVRERVAAGATVLLSSHVLPGIERHVDRVAILGNGRLLAAGTIEELRAAARLPVVIRLHGVRQGNGLNRFSQWPEITVRRFDDGVEITAPRERKLAILRAGMDLAELSDVSVAPASLDEVYAHFVASGAAGEGMP